MSHRGSGLNAVIVVWLSAKGDRRLWCETPEIAKEFTDRFDENGERWSSAPASIWMPPHINCIELVDEA